MTSEDERPKGPQLFEPVRGPSPYKAALAKQTAATADLLKPAPEKPPAPQPKGWCGQLGGAMSANPLHLPVNPRSKS
jgi:hypothetical protein